MTQKIDSTDIDVIIIGAGPAGGSTARELSKLGRKVLLIERSQEIGEPNFSTAGTPKETVEDFDLPKSVLSAEWDRIVVATPRVRAEWKFPETRGYVFDFAALRKFLAEDAAAHGAEIMVGTAVEDFVEENGKIVGVKYHGSLGSGEVRAKVIVDATGHNELANSKFKLNSVDSAHLGNGMEYVMTGLPPELARTMAFWMGPDYIAPGVYGYAWSFPMNGDKDGKIGICAYGDLPRNLSLDSMQKSFIDKIEYFKKMEPVEIHAGAARVDGGVKKRFHKNVVMVGDSAHQINPLGGEGVRHSLAAGKMTALLLDKHFKGGVFETENFAKVYQKEWSKKYSIKWRLSREVVSAASRLSQEQWDFAVELMQKITASDMFDLLFNYDYIKLVRYPHLIRLFLPHKKIG